MFYELTRSLLLAAYHYSSFLSYIILTLYILVITMTRWKGKRRAINLCSFWIGAFEGRLERMQRTSLHKWKQWALMSL